MPRPPTHAVYPPHTLGMTCPTVAAAGQSPLTGGPDETSNAATSRGKLEEGWGRAGGPQDLTSLPVLLHRPRLPLSGPAHWLTARSPLPPSLPPSLLPPCLPTATLTPAGLLRSCPAWGQASEGHKEA